MGETLARPRTDPGDAHASQSGMSGKLRCSTPPAVFISGLYLRRWLREREALASEPPQDMIA